MIESKRDSIVSQGLLQNDSVDERNAMTVLCHCERSEAISSNEVNANEKLSFWNEVIESNLAKLQALASIESKRDSIIRLTAHSRMTKRDCHD